MNGLATRKLAILGGEPAFSSPLHVGQPNIGDRQQFMASVEQIFDNHWLTNFGPFVGQFERELCRFLGVKHCLTVCNATMGLEIAARALGMAGEVIVPAFTFVATVHSLHWQGITPVFCDIDPASHTIDPEEVEPLITPRTTGIVGVHLWGRPCATEALQEIAKRHNLKLLFDAAHAFGCSCRGRMIGSFGDAEVFSFHATKFFNAFEGGAIVTNDDDLARRANVIRDFGFTGYDRVIEVGTNGKMTEVCAAMGLTNLQSLDDFVHINRRNYHVYRQELDALPGFRLIRYDESERGNFQYMAVEVDANQTGIGRDDLIKVLHAEKVLARRYFWPGCHRMEPYRTLYPDAGATLPRTEEIADRILVLPTGSAVNEEDIETICAILRAAVATAPEVRQRITGHG